jgi:hypothetical protein
MKFGNEFWLILFQEYISPKLFAVRDFRCCWHRGQVVANHLVIRILAAIINETDGKFAAGVNNMHRWKIIATLLGCLHLKVNLKKIFYLHVDSTTQKCPKKTIKTFAVEDFFHFSHCQQHGGALSLWIFKNNLKSSCLYGHEGKMIHK